MVLLTDVELNGLPLNYYFLNLGLNWWDKDERKEKSKITLLLFIPAHLDSFPKISTFKLGVKPQTFRWTLNTNKDTSKKKVFFILIREIHFDNENHLKLLLEAHLSFSKSNTTLLIMSSVFRKRWTSSKTFCLKKTKWKLLHKQLNKKKTTLTCVTFYKLSKSLINSHVPLYVWLAWGHGFRSWWRHMTPEIRKSQNVEPRNRSGFSSCRTVQFGVMVGCTDFMSLQ